jgi:hypothetical protein
MRVQKISAGVDHFVDHRKRPPDLSASVSYRSQKFSKTLLNLQISDCRHCQHITPSAGRTIRR